VASPSEVGLNQADKHPGHFNSPFHPKTNRTPMPSESFIGCLPPERGIGRHSGIVWVRETLVLVTMAEVEELNLGGFSARSLSRFSRHRSGAVARFATAGHRREPVSAVLW
jgi:hypothetical protein